MIRLITMYMGLTKEKRQASALMSNNELIEKHMMNLYRDEMVHVIAVGRKNKILLDKRCCIEKLDSLNELIKKSLMVVFESNSLCNQCIIGYLNNYSYEFKCFAPVAYSDQVVLYFPKLRYEDSYLLKYILERKSIDSKLDILFPNKMRMVSIT